MKESPNYAESWRLRINFQALNDLYSTGTGVVRNQSIIKGRLQRRVRYLAGRPTDLLRGSAAASPGTRIALANGIARSTSSSTTPVRRTTVVSASDNRRSLEPVHATCLPTLPLEIPIATLGQGLGRKRIEIHAVEVSVARAEIRIDFICVRGRPVREYIWEGIDRRREAMRHS